MEKAELLYRGKAKSAYLTTASEQLWLEFRDDISAYETKKDQLAGKGAVNNKINTFIMQTLEQAGIATHFIQQLSATEALVHRLNMIPTECVVRNVAAGSLSQRLGLDEGTPLEPAVFEFFLKNDELHDPFINESHIRTFGWATTAEIEAMKQLSYRVNQILKPLFAEADLLLVDFKLEFGRYQGKILLGDEFTPDGCRLWDIKTGEKFDKDRFRRDLGDVVTFYEAVATRLKI